ncbi:MAG: hypothetical protein Q7R76_05280 [Candidatus Woesearchaeota archaeon]|nr:hypothetical protein [Candidatus Woesearchaeota archaeon]
MVLSTTGLDHHVARLEDARRREQEITKYVARDVEELTEKIRAGETTGLPLKDWAIVAHGAEYQGFFQTASRLHAYLLGHPSELVLVYAAHHCAVECKEQNGRSANVGTLGDDGLAVEKTDQGLILSVGLQEGPLYVEQWDDFHHQFPLRSERVAAFIEKDPASSRPLNSLVQPSLAVEKTGAQCRYDIGGHRFIVRIEAGAPSVLDSMRSLMWSYRTAQPEMPPAAREFFKAYL